MKLAFLAFNEFFLPQVMGLLSAAEIDYYTRWDNVKGKGHGTEAHLGTGGRPTQNCAFMIGFEDEAPLRKLVADVTRHNLTIKRADDRVRLFRFRAI